MLDYRIHSFIVVCKYMNFTQAAQELGITQPAVSQHIHFLEREYDTKFFEYNGKKMSLSKEGKLLLDAATTMYHDEIFLHQRIHQIKEALPTLSMGVTHTLGEFVIANNLAKYLKKHPHASVKIQVSNTADLLDKMNQGELDFAIIEGFFPKNEYDSIVYSKEKFIAVCNINHQFKKNPKYVGDLLNETLLLREEGSGSRALFENILNANNLKIEDFKQIIEINNISAIKSLLLQDCGITFIYEAAIQQELIQNKLKKIHLEGQNFNHQFTFIWRKGSQFKDYYLDIFNEIKNKTP